MRYWDSSALIPVFVAESRSDEVRPLLKEDPAIITWWGTPVECVSALWRLKRGGVFQEFQLKQVRTRFDDLFEEIDMIAPSKLLRERALRLLALHTLRAADSLQLASALRWTQDQTRGVGFVSLDERLREAATAEGFNVLP